MWLKREMYGFITICMHFSYSFVYLFRICEKVIIIYIIYAYIIYLFEIYAYYCDNKIVVIVRTVHYMDNVRS